MKRTKTNPNRNDARRRLRLTGVILSLALLVTAVGCGDTGHLTSEQPPSEPEHTPGTTHALLITSDTDIAALEVHGVIDPDTLTFDGIWTPHDNALAWPYIDDDGAFTLGLITTTSINGTLAALVFHQHTQDAAPERVTLVAYDDTGTTLPNGTLNAAWLPHQPTERHHATQAAAALATALQEQGTHDHANP